MLRSITGTSNADHKTVGFHLVMNDAQVQLCETYCASIVFVVIIYSYNRRENRCAGWLNKAIANGPRGNKVPTSSGLGLLQLGAIVGKLTNALLQVAEHVVGLRFDCLGKGSVDTVGLGVEPSLADLNLCGIHLCYLFFRW